MPSKTFPHRVFESGLFTVLNIVFIYVAGRGIPATLGQDPLPDKYALLVGVTNYAKPELNTGLKFPEKDATDLAEVLKKSGFQVDLLLGKQATKSAILSKLRLFPQRGKNEGVIFVGLCGHGTEFADSRKSYFCPYDTAMKAARDKDDKALFNKDGTPMMGFVAESMVAIDDVLIAFGESLAANRILIADCCRDDPNRARGRSFGSSLAPDKLPIQTLMLLGCSSQERSLEHDDWGHGALTKCLLDQMELARGNPRTMGNIAEEVIPAVMQLVATNNRGNDKQTPRMLSTGRVEILLTNKHSNKVDRSTISRFRAIYNACLRAGLQAKESALAPLSSAEVEAVKQNLQHEYDSALAALEVDEVRDLASKSIAIKSIAGETLIMNGREKEAFELARVTSIELLFQRKELKIARERMIDCMKNGDFNQLRNYFHLAPLSELDHEAKAFLDSLSSTIWEYPFYDRRGEIYFELMLAQAVRGDLIRAKQNLEANLLKMSNGEMPRAYPWRMYDANAEIVATLMILGRDEEAKELVRAPKEQYPGDLFSDVAVLLAKAGKHEQAKTWFSTAKQSATAFMPKSDSAKSFAIGCVVSGLCQVGEEDEATRFLLSSLGEKGPEGRLQERLLRQFLGVVKTAKALTPAMRQLLKEWEETIQTMDVEKVSYPGDFAECLMMVNQTDALALIAKLQQRITEIEKAETRATKLFQLAQGIGRGVSTLESR